ncbi:MAG: hypothetical protein GY697_25185 [Desulfobacterales bacterium]|nr:hypothetical protein [Desulfobacterales bacterium]
MMTDKKSNDSRRKLLKSIAAGSGAVVAGKSLPESWSKPVINSIMLPAHAQLTDGSGNLPGEVTTTPQATTTPAPKDYFGLGLVLDHLTSLDKTEYPDIFADVVSALIPKAHASITDDIDMSVAVSGGSATVRFTNGSRNRMFNVVAPINGDASGTPTYEGSGCEPSKGPQSVQLVNFTPGDANVIVQVNGVKGSWSVEVPEATIGAMSVTC